MCFRRSVSSQTLITLLAERMDVLLCIIVTVLLLFSCDNAIVFGFMRLKRKGFLYCLMYFPK